MSTPGKTRLDRGGPHFVVACTGQLWAVWQEDPTGGLRKVNQPELPAFTIEVCLRVIGSLGYPSFHVSISR